MDLKLNVVEVGGNINPQPDLPTTRIPDVKIADNVTDPGKEISNWVLTIWDDDIKNIKTKFDEGQIVYFVYQLESCPKTGRGHWQVYIELKRGRSFAWIKANISNTAYIYRRLGTQAEAIAYCIKNESRMQGPWQFGKPKKMGNRTDWDIIKEMFKDGKSIKEVADIYPTQYGMCTKGVLAMKNLFTEPRYGKSCQLYMVNLESGGGKTSYIYAKFGIKNIYCKDESKWWDGYDNQKIVLFDEAWYHDRSSAEWHKIIDMFPHKVQTKGGYMELTSLIFIICNSKGIAFDGFKSDNDMVRRITKWLTLDDLTKDVERPILVTEPNVY